ncbi:MAG: glycosyltransferase family 9 protein, partial [Pseudomonadota bacterium]|nr:glycosyltransferase family 9 protein [Pseudomonadota bacterium]
KKFYPNRKVFLLTTQPYSIFMSECPYLDGVLIDKRLPRWNLFYLNNLKKTLAKYDFSRVFDLQNSNRTKFYKRFIIKNAEWSSTETALEPGQKKRDFEKDPVLDRMEIQLKKSGIDTEFTKNIDLSWATENASYLVKYYTNREYILLFPFCSPKLVKKKWPYYQELIQRLKQEFKNKYSVLLAPGPNELEEANQLNAKVILENNQPVNIKTLISLIHDAKFIIANDTGPAHIASHLDKKGIVLFGSHTSAKKVSIENFNFKAITVKDLKDLKVETVISEVKSKLN